MFATSQKSKKILAIASGGGHWKELRRLEPVFEGHRTVFVTVNPLHKSEVGSAKFYVVNYATRWNKWGSFELALRMAWIILKERPEVVISTGSEPGFFGIFFGKLFGGRTVWLDILANAQEVSLSGRLARRFSDLWLTQWPHLAKPGGPHYRGAVI